MAVKEEADVVDGLSDIVFLEWDSWTLSSLAFTGMECVGEELERW